jgi:FkbM family methyltransferase
MDLPSASLDSRTKTFNSFRRIFKLPVFEHLLIKLIRKYPRNMLLRKLQPNNNLYRSPAIRKVNRWGLHFELDISDYQDWLIYFVSEQDSSFEVLKFLSEGDHVIDIGGNIGQTALRIAQKIGAGGHVISFEPYLHTFQKYKTNLSRNPAYRSIIEVENKGLGIKEETVKMYRDCVTNSGGNRVLHAEAVNPSGMVDVSITTLDAYIALHGQQRIDFIKIDAEGFELNVLKGAEATLLKHHPRLFIELNDENLREQGGSGSELIAWLEDRSYTIIRVDTEEPVVSASYNGEEHYDIYCSPRSGS